MGLGYMHLNGLGTSVNMTAAIEAYEGAASMEYPDACFYLGGLYGGECSACLAFNVYAALLHCDNFFAFTTTYAKHLLV